MQVDKTTELQTDSSLLMKPPILSLIYSTFEQHKYAEYWLEYDAKSKIWPLAWRMDVLIDNST